MTITRRKATDADLEFARAAHHAAYHDVVCAQFGGWDDARQDGFFMQKWENRAAKLYARLNFTAYGETSTQILMERKR